MSLLNVSILQQKNPSTQFIKYPHYHLLGNKIVIRNEYVSARPCFNVHENSKSQLKKKGTVATIKSSSISIIEKRITTWIKSIEYFNNKRENKQKKKKHYPIFLTLTLPAQQIHDDKIIKREILMPFIQSLKRIHGLKYYFWRAELQQSFNIHFHLIGDVYIDKNELQLLWNKHLNALGYIDRFEKKYKHRNPPSTHIEAVKGASECINYITKYCTKQKEVMWIDGRKWAMSKELREIRPYAAPLDTETGDYFEQLIVDNKVDIYKNDYATILYFNKNFNYNIDFQPLAEVETSYYVKLYQELYEIPPVIHDIVQSVRQTRKPISQYTISFW